MAIQTLNTIKNWFKTTLKPTQQQFWDTWDSFRHKFEKVPVKDVEGIDELLNTKADKTAFNNHLADKDAHAPQVNTDWNSESGFSQLLNKPEFKTINGESIIGTSNIDIAPTLQQVLAYGNTAIDNILTTKDSDNRVSSTIAPTGLFSYDFSNDLFSGVNSGVFFGSNSSDPNQKNVLDLTRKSTDIGNAIFKVPLVPTGEYELALKSDIPSASSQNLNQVLSTGDTATNKIMTIRDNSSEGSKVIVSPFYVDLLSKNTQNPSIRGGVLLGTEGGSSSGESWLTGNLGLRYSYINGSESSLDQTTYLQTSRSPITNFFKLPYNADEAKQTQILPVTVNGVSADKTGNIEISAEGGSQDLQSVVDNGSKASKEGGFNNFIDILGGSEDDRYIWGMIGTSDNTKNSSLGVWKDQAYLANSLNTLSGSVAVRGGKAQLEKTRNSGGGSSTVLLEFADNLPYVSSNIKIPVPTVAGDYTLATTNDIEVSATAQTLQKTLENGSEAEVTNKNIIIKSNNTDLGIGSAIYIAPNTLTDSRMVGLYIHTDAVLSMRGMNGFSLSSEGLGGNISASPNHDFILNSQSKKLILQGGHGSSGGGEGVIIKGMSGTIELVGTAYYNEEEIATKNDINLQQSLLSNNRTNQSIKVQDEAPDTEAYINYVSYTSEGINGRTETGHAYYYSSDGMRVSAVGGGELTYTSGDRSLKWNADTENPKSNRLSLDKTTDGEAVFNLPEKATGNYTLATTDDISRQGLEDATILYHKLPFLQEGTISNTGTSVTGVGTDFDVWDIGSKIVKANGETAIIATVTNGISITTVEPFATDSSSSTYKVYHKAYELMEDGATNFYPYNRGVSPTIKITADNTVRLHDQEFRPNGNVQGINEWKFGNTALYEDDIKLFKWGSLLSSSGPNEPTDIGFKRHEAGIWEINNGTPENYADLMLRKVVMTATDYSNDTDADADTTLPSGGLYTVNGDRTVRRKP
ncbi:hypothetical protein [Flavobacterium sp.]|uniref:hypothetical protein n=1 Tax=Flavobacterium sp. TaxID=239 RepID=UPI002ED8D7B8